MSGEQVSLRDYIEKIINLHFLESQRALDKATDALNYRLESMNEFRAQINSERGTYITRTSFETEQRQRALDQKAMEARLAALEREFNNLQGNIQGRMYVFGIVIPMALAAIVSLIMRLIK